MDKIKKVIAGIGLGVMTVSAFAQSAPAVDFTPVTNAIDVSGTSTELITVAGSLMGVTMVLFALRKLFGLIHRG